MFLRAILSIILSLASVSWAAEQDVIPALDTTNPAALQEATRVLEEEIKLAARPQTYVVIDLEAKAILIKSRGVELHHLPIESWSASHLSQLATALPSPRAPYRSIAARLIPWPRPPNKPPSPLPICRQCLRSNSLPRWRSLSFLILMAIPGNGLPNEDARGGTGSNHGASPSTQGVSPPHHLPCISSSLSTMRNLSPGQ